MTFKQFMTAVAYLPATAFSGMVNLTLGSTSKDENGDVELDEYDNPVVNRGLLGWILDGIKFVGRGIADFIADHKKAIAIACWTSLALAGAAALTVFLWPAALAAVTTFSIYGISIAGIVGANTLLQIGAIAALTFAATSAVTYLLAGIVNTINAIKECCTSPSQQTKNTEEEEELIIEEPLARSTNPLSQLSSTEPQNNSTESKEDVAPVHTTTLFADPTEGKQPIQTNNNVEHLGGLDESSTLSFNLATN